MFTILITTVMFYGSQSGGVTHTTLGAYESKETCETIARQLNNTREVRNRNVVTLAQCVQTKDVK